MNRVEGRLEACFRAVATEEVCARLRAEPDEPITELDSLQWVTLLTLIEEEFEVEIDYAILDTLWSYQSVRRMVDPGT